MSTKAEDTQKNILDTARKHFLKDGLTGASLRNIVKDAGLTTGAFYKYYPTKEAPAGGEMRYRRKRRRDKSQRYCRPAGLRAVRRDLRALDL